MASERVRVVTLDSWYNAVQRVDGDRAQVVLQGETPGGKRLDVVIDLSAPWMVRYLLRQCREIAERRVREWQEASRGE